MNSWFELYPEFLKNELYLSGVSYGGVYVPTLARNIMDNVRMKPTIFRMKSTMN